MAKAPTSKSRQISVRAFELIFERDAFAWNSWRREYNLFGDNAEARISLSDTNLSNFDLRDFILTNVDFSRATLNSSLFEGCDCTSVSFYLATLNESDFTGACLRGANLSRAYLRNTKLDQADVRLADLRRASLTGASMFSTDVRGVDLSNTRGLSQEQITLARGDERTKLPTHLERPESWSRYARKRVPKPSPGTIPEPSPATVEVFIEMGRVALARDAGDALFMSSFDVDNIRQEIIDDLSDIIPRIANSGALYRACLKYLSAIREKNCDIIIVGMRGVSLSALVHTLSIDSQNDLETPELLPDVVGSLNGIILQHFLYVNQSHRWRSFFEEATRSNFSGKDLSHSERHGHELAELLRTHPSASMPQVPDALDQAVTETRERNSDAKLLVFNVYAGIQNVLRTVVGWCVREFKKFGGSTWDNFRDTLSKRIGVAAATLVFGIVGWFTVSGLASAWPEYFGWFIFFSNLLK